MKRLLSPTIPRLGVPAQLAEAEAKHALQVLRMRTGEKVIAMDAQGGMVLATLRVAGEKVFLDFAEEATDTTSSKPLPQPLPITLELGVLKGEAMEWVVEKAVELNVSTLVPVLTDHTVVQIDRKGPSAFQERWQRIADQSLKQCGRLNRMNVEMPVRLQEYLGREIASKGGIRLFCDETERSRAPHLMNWLQAHWVPGTAVHLMIGPEGGWSAHERQMIFAGGLAIETVSLGPWVLRGETAALFGMSLLAGVLQSKT